MSKEDNNSEEKIDWIYRESTKKLLLRGLVIACVIFMLAELIVFKRKPHAPADWGFGFFGLFGFIACSLTIVIATALGYVLKKPTGFYENDSAEEDAS